jgi:hypothetical protein
MDSRTSRRESGTARHFEQVRLIGCGESLACEGDADRLQRNDQPMGLVGLCSDKLWYTLHEDTARAAQVSADEFPYRDEMY